jgi:hypothetical protein
MKSALVKCGLAASSRSGSAVLTGRRDWHTTRHSQLGTLRLTNSCPFVLAQRADTDVADSSHECYHRDRAYYEIPLTFISLDRFSSH